MFFKDLHKYLASVLFPVFCVSCSSEGQWWCVVCQKQYPFLSEVSCPVCSVPTTQGKICNSCSAVSPLLGLTALFNYDETAPPAKLIKALKYQGAADSGQVWVKIFKDYLTEHKPPWLTAGDVTQKSVSIIPVPLHPKRELRRGFNQAQVLGTHLVSVLGEDSGVQLLVDGLYRIKDTPQQARLNGVERRQNLKEAFCWQKNVAPERVVLLDDVFTTGSTMLECARVLKNAGTQEVWGLVIARG